MLNKVNVLVNLFHEDMSLGKHYAMSSPTIISANHVSQKQFNLVKLIPDDISSRKPWRENTLSRLSLTFFVMGLVKLDPKFPGDMSSRKFLVEFVQSQRAWSRKLKRLFCNVSITTLTFGMEFTAAIEAKQVAAQEAERAKFVVERLLSKIREVPLSKNM
ncbi:prohibitin-1, mitochondrial [Tanacetum coccineum]